MILKKGKPDYWLFLLVLILLCTGFVMVLSSSQYFAQNKPWENSFYFFQRQLGNAAVGLLFMVALMNINYRKLRKVSNLGIVVCGVLLLLVVVMGVAAKGGLQWLELGILRFQPSELMKLALILFFAKSLSDNRDKLGDFRHGFLPYLCVLGIVCVLVAKEDLGSGAIIAATAFIMLYVAGVKPKYLLSLIGLGLVAFAALVIAKPYRAVRLFTFLDPWKDPQGAGYQTIQSLLAIGSGGLSGAGLGAGGAKYFLPEGHTDFIFSTMAEDLGFFGGLFLILLFAAFAWRGFTIAWRMKDSFGSLLACGLTVSIVLQAIINIGIALGVLPVTGITLPFISYGGSSLVITLAAVGVLLNISRYTEMDG